MSREAPVRIREGLGVQLPRATRLVIWCRGTADQAMTTMRTMMSKLRLTVNETKTRLRRIPEETFDFLGYRILGHSGFLRLPRIPTRTPAKFFPNGYGGQADR